MKWTRLGKIFVPTGDTPWMQTHAAVPFAEHGPVDGPLRLYFNTRDSDNRARVASLDLDLASGQVMSVSREPLLNLGAAGTFDENGVIGSWVVEHQGEKYLYYAGLTLGVSVPFYFYAGLAISTDGGVSFEKIANAPILERNAVDPYLTGQLSILVEGGLWRMWYVSGDRWERSSSGVRHYYHIKYAESTDGIVWRRDGRTCIDFVDGECAIARPCVVKDPDGYRMWYCYRGSSYRIGYAESADGLSWTRHDDLSGLEYSASGWDSQMLAYPFVFDHGMDRLLFYNGNDFGRTGVGWAKLIHD